MKWRIRKYRDFIEVYLLDDQEFDVDNVFVFVGPLLEWRLKRAKAKLRKRHEILQRQEAAP